MSLCVLEGVLRYVARVRADLEYPDFLIKIKDTFDILMVQMWQRSQSKQISRSQFLRAWRQPLALSVDMQQAVQVKAHSEGKKETSLKLVESHMRSSLIGSELFAQESAVAELRAFVLDIERRLFELEQADFSEAEVSAFKALCQHNGES